MYRGAGLSRFSARERVITRVPDALRDAAGGISIEITESENVGEAAVRGTRTDGF